MKAVATVAVKARRGRPIVPSLRRDRGDAKPKIVRPGTSKTPPREKERGLTEKQRANLVLTYRLKARKLARSILRKWRSRLDLQEVDSVVDLSLCEAVRRFNPSKGAGFMTFMFYHLRGNLIRAVAAAANANVVPVAEFDAHERSEGELQGELPIALRASANEIAASLAGEEYLSPDEVLMKKELSRVSARACEALDPLEREIVERIFVQEEQLMDIAQSLGYSRCHISRVKKKALDTLQGNLAQYVEVSSSEEVAPDESLENANLPRRKRLRARKYNRTLEAQVTELEAA